MIKVPGRMKEKMPRAPRIQLEGALYYVTTKGIQGMNLFGDKMDYLMYEELLGKYKNQLGFKLFAFALLPAHIHLLVETKPEISLSEIMHNITSAYTKYFNKKYNRQGHLFRGRFRACVIEKEPYLLRLTRHIHLNHKRLNLTNEAGDPYSTYPYYLNNGIQGSVPGLDITSEVAEALSYLSGKNYEDYLKEETSEEGEKLHNDLHQSLFLGSPDFGKRIKDTMTREALKASEEVARVRVRTFMGPAISGIVLVALIAAALVYVQTINKKAAVIPVPKEEMSVPMTEEPQAIDAVAVGLDATIWHVKFVAGTPFQSIDVITFKDGKMTSENMALNGYATSNYLVAKDDSRLSWETMQTSKTGVALWRGEVDGSTMKGVLSLRPKDGKPQDFSFVSLKYQKSVISKQ